MDIHGKGLMAPGSIGSLALRNRVIVAAMGVNLAEPDGSCGEQLIAFHERQAAGGAAVIVLGSAGVAWPNGGNEPRQVAISDDCFIPGLKALAQAIHQHGAKVAVQLHHGGLVAVEDRAAGRPMWGPSVPVPASFDLPELMLEQEMAEMFGKGAPSPSIHVMEKADIAELVAQFAAAASRAKQAGIDAVEIHAGHGYIISEFLSPLVNQRDDEYGGLLANRARLLLEIIAAVREAVGEDYPVWCKLDSEEIGRPEGISLADARATAQLVAQAGADAIAVSAYHDPGRGALHSESNIPHTPERLLRNAEDIRRQVGIPIIATGRIEPARASRHIADGRFDFLAMGRKLLADPDLPNKLHEGRADQIRPCVYCYCCVSQIYLRRPVKCAVNPEVAQERERAIIATTKQRHIAVVGAGPAGMEAARRLSLCGHRVTLIEAGDRLGGTLAFAGIAYPPNLGLLAWLRDQIDQVDIDVRLNCRADAALLQELGIDEVIVATGAIRELPDIPGSDRDFVFSGDEMRALVAGERHPGLARKTSIATRSIARMGALVRLGRNPRVVRAVSRAWMPLGRRIVIIGAELVGLELAEYLAERGRKVTVIDGASRPGAGLYLVRRMRLLHELQHLGVTLLNRASDIAIADQAVTYTNFRKQRRSIDADHVIVAQGASGDTSLADELRKQGMTVHSIGDCNGVGYIEGAMEDAAELVREITAPQSAGEVRPNAA